MDPTNVAASASSALTPWLALAGLGVFHGLNPAMGWLFAVALGLHRRSRGVVWLSLIPIALGHAGAIVVTLAALLALGLFLEHRILEIGAGLLLIGWAAYHARYGHRGRVRVGMTTGMTGLALWSFLMATAHGAGLMLSPLVIALCIGDGPAKELFSTGSAQIALAATGVHTLAMLATTALAAALVYEWLGVAFLRRGWFNLDALWTGALAITGAILLIG